MVNSLLLAGAAALAAAQVDIPEIPGITYGGYSYVNPSGQWIPPTTAYSKGEYKQVVMLSFDGMHQFDLMDYVAKYPNSTWATIILKNGIMYENARASEPSDSFPATTALFCGASPRVSGIWWDDVYDRALYPAGSNCTGPIGSEAAWDESNDLNSSLIDGGGALNPVYPHNYLRVNTVFEVGRANGLVTAYADKHLTYEFMNGPSGVGLSEIYTPEVASVANTIQAQLAWDDLHWSALRNWTKGNFANGTTNPDGPPSMYGANFQAITWAQTNAGYLDALGAQPNKSLEMALQYADARLGTFLGDLKAAGQLDSTLLLVGSKQGQGPINAANETFISDVHLTASVEAAGIKVAQTTADDGGIMWLVDQSQAQAAKANLLANTTLGVAYVLAGDEIQHAGFGSPWLDSRVPDLIIGAKVGYLWASSPRFEDHGGYLPQDLNVPLIAYNPYLEPANNSIFVSNRQVASTMVKALGLPLAQLDGYRIEGTPVLPGVFKWDN
ncbi:hypothetical protein LTR48_004307 [Friedmanniomyces endolithicus]|uniref:Uncharacterized protein n=1 Tax=Rachicladosporium monterosium TaxID=1507873 RepID=A0ABR0L5M0_9PEZI|nr:hypothetical protein LTR48_004307 [Friedmanniomyces endolithicus]KAK5143859.1 hypothetical protein LTR32_004096 [Rachicladosporium monterosium]